jgi:hypothetical protein
MAQINHLRCIRFWLTLFIVGLVLSSITAFPLQTELAWLVSFFRKSSVQSIAESTGLLPWIERVNEGLSTTNARYPFLAYGTDWLAFAHRVIAVAFIGPLSFLYGCDYEFNSLSFLPTAPGPKLI